jgi:hypothetical protein
MTAKEALVTAALLGTENHTIEPLKNIDQTSQLELLINNALTREESTTESRLLSAASIVFQYERAGMILPQSDDASDIAVSEEDNRPLVNEKLSLSFRRIVEDFPKLKDEWFVQVDKSKNRLPEDLLPEVLDFLTSSKRDLIEPELLKRVIGARGVWLCSMNPEWKILDDAMAPVSAELFDTGDFNIRCSTLSFIREEDPAKARELVKKSWQENIPAERAAFIEILKNNLSQDDESLLEFALDDTRMEVRQAAASLLAFLPDSAYSKRMKERFDSIVQIKKGFISSKLEINVSFEYSKDMKRDGMNQKLDYVQGEKAGIVVQIINNVNPEIILKSSGLSPDKLLKLITESEWKDTLLVGLVQSAIKFKNQEILLSMLLSDIPYLLEIEMFAELESDQKEKVVASWIDKSNGNLIAAHNGFRHIECINRMEYPWSRQMSDRIFTAMQKMLSEKNNEYFLAPFTLTVATFADSSILDKLDKATADCAYLSDSSIDRIHSLITLRKTILASSPSS